MNVFGVRGLGSVQGKVEPQVPAGGVFWQALAPANLSK